MSRFFSADPTLWKNRTIAIVSIIFSIGWIIGAAYLHMETAGGRGGAIAVAISFYFLFIGGETGSDVYKILTRNTDNVDTKVNAIVSWINTASAASNEQNKYLAVSSIVGTIAWGFGDIAARNVPQLLLIFVSHINQYIPQSVSSFIYCGINSL